jgi:hypothetical protein
MNIAKLIHEDGILSVFDFESAYRILLRLKELGLLREK